MLIKQQSLLTSFPSKDFPSFPCPQCGSTLTLVSDSLFISESAESSMLHETGTIGPDEGSGVFCAMLSCVNRRCSESVAMSGRNHPGADEQCDGSPYIEYFLDPLFFTPTINLFEIPESTPDQVRKPLLSSFASFWADPSGAGNSLRTAVEGLMDYRGIKKWKKATGKKETIIPLHARIVEFTSHEKELGELLLAIKWIGNAGSHSNKLEKENVLQGYQMFEHVLLELFLKRTENLVKAAKKINKNKKPQPVKR